MPTAEVTVKGINKLWSKDDKALFGIAGTYKKDGKDEGLPQFLQFWSTDGITDLITVGETLRIEFAIEPNKKDESKKDHWVKSVNGKAIAEAPKRGGGGGTGKTYTPKSAVEIHAPQIGAIIAAAIHAGTNPKDALDLYRSECAKYQTQTSGKAGAS